MTGYSKLGSCCGHPLARDRCDVISQDDKKSLGYLLGVGVCPSPFFSTVWVTTSGRVGLQGFVEG